MKPVPQMLFSQALTSWKADNIEQLLDITLACNQATMTTPPSAESLAGLAQTPDGQQWWQQFISIEHTAANDSDDPIGPLVLNALAQVRQRLRVSGDDATDAEQTQQQKMFAIYTFMVRESLITRQAMLADAPRASAIIAQTVSRHDVELLTMLAPIIMASPSSQSGNVQLKVLGEDSPEARIEELWLGNFINLPALLSNYPYPQARLPYGVRVMAMFAQQDHASGPDVFKELLPPVWMLAADTLTEDMLSMAEGAC